LSCGVIQDNATEVGIGGVPVTGIRLTVYGNAHFLSDKNYKKNVAPLNNALAKVKQLKGWYYDWDTQKHPDMGLSDTRQLGFMAQDVGKILPEAVSTSPEGTVLMNYNALIPVLTEAIKEQDATIEAQKTTIESLEERVNRLETALEQLLGQEPKNLKTGFKLEQNTPNPFRDKTVLAYEMPKNMGSAQIIITDLAGRLLKTIQLKDCCGTVEISAQDFVNGTFIYSLVANGKVLKTNKMVVAKN
jgi:Chaperone of endosialidase